MFSMSHLLFSLICCIWGTSFLLTKWALRSFDFVGIGAARVVLGAIALWFVVIWHRRPIRLALKDAFPLAMLAVIGYAVPFCVMPYLIGKVEAHAGHGSAFGGMTLCFVPILTIIVSVPLLKTLPTTRQFVGVVGGLGCMWLLFADELKQGVPISLVLLALVTPSCYAFSNTFIKRRFHDAPPLVLSMYALAAASLLLVPISVRTTTVHVSDAFWLAVACLLVLGPIATGLGTFLFYRLIQGHGPLYAGMVSYVIPCVATLLGLLSGETITLGQLVAVAGALGMVALTQLSPSRLVPTDPVT